MDRRKIDVVFTSFLILVSLIILSDDSLSQGGVETELGSLFLPRIVAVFIIIFSAFIGASSLLQLLRKAQQQEIERISLNGFLGVNIYVGIFIAYWFFVPYVGFLVATPLVMFAVAMLLGGRNWPAITAMSLVVPVLLFYGSSYFLRVFLPTWSLT